MIGEMKLFKVSFFPIMVRDEKGEAKAGGRWMTYVVAPNVFRIGDVLKAFLPELYDEGFDVEEEIVRKDASSRMWSVTIGPEGRTMSVLIEAPDEQHAHASLVESMRAMPLWARYVEMKLFRTREIDFSREGVA